MNQTQTKIEENELEILDKQIDDLDTKLTTLNKKHEIAVDFIVEWTLDKLDLEDYDLVIKYMIANRHLHEEVPQK